MTRNMGVYSQVLGVYSQVLKLYIPKFVAAILLEIKCAVQSLI